MLGDASSNLHMQYLREGVLMTEAEENKLNQTSFIKVNNYFTVCYILMNDLFVLGRTRISNVSRKRSLD
jgi:hypothetical protein